MPRLALCCAYDGTGFVGWQTQARGRSVQRVVAEAVSQVAAERIDVHGAGRTDAGVHATGQVAHFDTTAIRTPRQWLLGINSNLPDDVAILWIREVGETFDARRSALWREYAYTIANQPVRPVLERHTVWWIRDALDCGAMAAAACAWLGELDFSAFRAAQCQSPTPMRNMLRIGVSRAGTRIVLRFRANAFLYHMVRNLVGALAAIGRGAAPPEWARQLLAGRDRSAGAMTAPPQGLRLETVAYAPAFGLPAPVGSGRIHGIIAAPEHEVLP